MDDSTSAAGKSGPRIVIPAAEYRDPAIDRLEEERLWPRIWQMACREAELKAPGDFVTHDILDDSILIIRTGTGEDDVTAMYNVCRSTNGWEP